MAVFIKITESFVLSNGKDKDLAPQYKKPIVGRFKKVKPDTICLSMDHVSFKCGLQNKVSQFFAPWDKKNYNDNFLIRFSFHYKN